MHKSQIGTACSISLIINSHFQFEQYYFPQLTKQNQYKSTNPKQEKGSYKNIIRCTRKGNQITEILEQLGTWVNR